MPGQAHQARQQSIAFRLSVRTVRTGAAFEAVSVCWPSDTGLHPVWKPVAAWAGFQRVGMDRTVQARAAAGLDEAAVRLAAMTMSFETAAGVHRPAWQGCELSRVLGHWRLRWSLEAGDARVEHPPVVRVSVLASSVLADNWRMLHCVAGVARVEAASQARAVVVGAWSIRWQASLAAAADYRRRHHMNQSPHRISATIATVACFAARLQS